MQPSIFPFKKPKEWPNWNGDSTKSTIVALMSESDDSNALNSHGLDFSKRQEKVGIVRKLLTSISRCEILNIYILIKVTN